MEQPDGPIHKNDIRFLLQSARTRRAIAGCEDIFGDPAFEILLAVSLYQNDGSQCIEQVIEAVELPEENVSRWLTALEHIGLLETQAMTIRLTARAMSILDATLRKS
jgi:hypothetical protein